MKKGIAILLLTLLLMPLLSVLLTASADTDGTPKYTAYTHSDGSVTKVYADGSVSTEYKDGSLEGFDGEGNRFTRDADGTRCVYAPDGSISAEYPDGTRSLTEADGQKQVINRDGSGRIIYPSGLTFDYDTNQNYTAVYFEGGSERLTADAEGNFPTGEIRGGNGEKLVNSEDGLYLKGANGVEYSLSESANTASIVHPDGTRMDAENGSGTITFADGTRFVSAGDGTGRFVMPDGSYIMRDTESDAWELFDAGDGSHIKVNERGELTDMLRKDGGNVIDIRDGKIREWIDTEARVTIRSDEKGTTVETPEGTYFTDGNGSIFKDGKPLYENTTPSGEREPTDADFVPVQDKFDLENRGAADPADYAGLEGLYLTFEYMLSQTANFKWGDAYYGIDSIWGGGMTVTHTVSDKPTVTLIKGKTADSFTLTGTYSLKEPVLGGMLVGDTWVENYVYRSEISLNVSNLRFEDGLVQADLSGHVEAADGVNDTYTNTLSDDFPMLHVTADYRALLKSGTIRVSLRLPKESSASGRSEMSIAFRIERVLPVERPETGSNPQGTVDYVRYDGKLTYENGDKNEYGQPLPDLMDFNGDGRIDYTDRQIREVLAYNPDALDTPEGAALVVTAIITALLGTGGGAAAAAAAAAGGLGSGGAGLQLGGTDDADSDEEKPKKARAEVGSLGPYIRRDDAGDLNVTDPATGEERVYCSNGDGTYTNPVTGATYTGEELKSALDSRAENADAIRRDEAARKEAVRSQREENREKSQIAKEYEKQQAEEREREKREEAHDAYVGKMMDKHGRYTEEGVRESIADKQGKAEIEGYEQREYEKEYEKSQKYTENVKAGADIAIDVLAKVEPTGVGETIKDGYAVASAAASNAGDVMAGYKTVGGAIVQTAVDSGVELLKNHSDGAVEKYASNIMGDSVKAMSDTYMKGGSVEDIRKAGESAAIQGGVNATVDVAFDAFGGKAAEKVGLSGDKVITTIGGQAITKGAAGDAAGTVANDLAKMALTPEDAGEAGQRAFRDSQEKAEQDANAEAAAHFRQSQREWAERRNGDE